MSQKMFGFVALLALTSCGESSGPGDGRSPTLLPNEFVYEAEVDGNYEIFRTALDSAPINLTSDPETDYAPELSHDRRRIAFASWRSGSSDIYVMNIDGTGLRRVTSDPGFESDPSWSPDDKRLVFTAMNATQYLDLSVVELSTGVVTPLWSETAASPGSAQEGQPAFAPSGNEILYVRGPDIYKVKDDGSQRTLVIRDGVQPRISPDGSTIVFTRYLFLPSGATNFNIATVSRDGSSLQLLTNDAIADSDPAWSSDGARIMFRRQTTPPASVAEAGNHDLYLMNRDGSSLRRLTSEPGWEGHPSW